MLSKSKIRKIDFLIVVFILSVMPAFFQTYKIMVKKPRIVPHVWIKVKAVSFVEPGIAKLIKPGDVAYDNLGYLLEGKLINVSKEDIPRHYITDILHKYRTLIFLEFELLCTKSMHGEPWYYRREPLFVTLDEPFNFVTDRYSIWCHSIKIGD